MIGLEKRRWFLAQEFGVEAADLETSVEAVIEWARKARPRETEFFLSYFGLLGSPPRDYKELSAQSENKISPSRVRELSNKAQHLIGGLIKDWLKRDCDYRTWLLQDFFTEAREVKADLYQRSGIDALFFLRASRWALRSQDRDKLTVGDLLDALADSPGTIFKWDPRFEHRWNAVKVMLATAKLRSVVLE